MADNVGHPRWLDSTMELITYSFVLYLQHGRHHVMRKPSIQFTATCGCLTKVIFHHIDNYDIHVSLSAAHKYLKFTCEDIDNVNPNREKSETPVFD